ncbi:papain-like cysteine protease family protein [Massilia niabensis]|uniref:Papain-like cysteine protease family protein n=1 Tax=Massilia niabensis TaxID=544910 RepID=A0ABW0L938_9BURK
MKGKIMSDIKYRVPVIAQSRTMSCWAAATAMLMSWKRGFMVTEEEAARLAGNNFLIAFRQNQGVTGAEIAELAVQLALTAEPPSSHTSASYRSLLASKGPLWVGTAIFSTTATYRHVRILSGIRGPEGDPDPVLDIIDPDGGRSYGASVSHFALELEEIARQDLGAGQELRPQIIHYP